MSDACGEKEKEREHGKNAQRVTLKENLQKRNCKLPPYLINAVLIYVAEKPKTKLVTLFIFLHKHMRWVVVRVHSYLATVGLSVRRYWYRT